MIQRILHRCPVCGGHEWLRRSRCRHCLAAVSAVSPAAVTVNGKTATLSHWYDVIRGLPLTPAADGVLLAADGVALYQERYAGWRDLAAPCASGKYLRQRLDRGRLVLTWDGLEFSGRRRHLQISGSRLAGVTIESNTLIVGLRHAPTVFFSFFGGVGKRWEDALRAVVDSAHRPARITAYYPRFAMDSDRIRPPRTGPPPVLRPLGDKTPPRRSVLFNMLRPVVRRLVYPRLPVSVHGAHAVPAQGPAVILPNHGSLLDAILLGAALPRPICFMSKNSEFENPVLSHVLRQLAAFPVRRYAVDAQAVRNASRIVQDGRLLGIFPEGERTWDGRLLPLRRGTLRLLLVLGVPIIPVGISGTFLMMPRWTHRIRRHPVTIRFGAPIRLPALPPGLHTPTVLGTLDRLLRRRLGALLPGLEHVDH